MRSTSVRIREFHSEITIEPDEINGLDSRSVEQCQDVRAASPGRIVATRGNVGPLRLAQIRETLAVLFDIA